jgi:hypothetical protein
VGPRPHPRSVTPGGPSASAGEANGDLARAGFFAQGSLACQDIEQEPHVCVEVRRRRQTASASAACDRLHSIQASTSFGLSR